MTTTIRPWNELLTPWPTDFIWTQTFVEKTSIMRRVEGVHIHLVATFPRYGTYTTPAYYIFVMTQHGEIRIEVSKRVFDLLQDRDPIVVSYRQGRWSGVLEGKIAQ